MSVIYDSLRQSFERRKINEIQIDQHGNIMQQNTFVIHSNVSKSIVVIVIFVEMIQDFIKQDIMEFSTYKSSVGMQLLKFICYSCNVN